MNGSATFGFAAACAVAGLPGLGSVAAGEIDVATYAWEKRIVTDVAPEADEPKDTLAETVRGMLDAGHLGPYFTSRGEGQAHWYFRNPGDLVGALAAAYPHLPEEMRPEVVAYLRSEMAAYPPWSDVELRNSDPRTTRRNSHPLPEPDFRYDPRRRWPRLHNVYAVWRYADATGDWETIRLNASKIEGFYERHRKELRLTYGETAAAVGMARIARRLGDEAAVERALADLRGALAHGLDPEAMRDDAWNAYRLGRNKDDRFTVHGFFCLNITPEIARFVVDHPETKRKATAPIDEGVRRYPMWFVSQASCFMRLYGESHAITPLYSRMIFPMKALVEEAPSEELARWVDAEDAPVGDLFFVERLVLAIEAYGEARWVKVDGERNEPGGARDGPGKDARHVPGP